MAVVGVNAARTCCGDLRGRGADQRGLLWVDVDLDLGRRLDEVTLQVGDVRAAADGGHDGIGGLLDGGLVVAADDDVQVVIGEAGGLGHRDRSPVPDRIKRAGKRFGLRVKVDAGARGEWSWWPSWRAGPAARRGWSGSSCRCRRARSFGPARRCGWASRMRSASVATARTACEEAPAGGASVTPRIFSEPALMNWVGRLPDERQRGHEQGRGHAERRPAWSAGCAGRT